MCMLPPEPVFGSTQFYGLITNQYILAPTPMFIREAGDLLTGKQASDASIAEACEAARTAARPIDDMRGTIRQRVHLVGVLTQRALRTSIGRARLGEQK